MQISENCDHDHYIFYGHTILSALSFLEYSKVSGVNTKHLYNISKTHFDCT